MCPSHPTLSPPLQCSAKRSGMSRVPEKQKWFAAQCQVSHSIPNPRQRHPHSFAKKYPRMHKSRCFEDRKAMGGRTWRLMHQGHSRGCAFLQCFLCLRGVSPAVSASVSQFGKHGAIVARGKPPLRPFGACFGRVGRLVLAASRQKGWARTMGRALEQLSARQVLLTRSMCVGGLGARESMQRAPNYMPQAKLFSPTGRF